MISNRTVAIRAGAALAVALACALSLTSAAGRAWLGVHVTEDSAHSEGGALVERVLVGSPAEHAGVLVGDVLVEIDGQAIADPTALRGALREHAAGDRVGVTVVRDGARRTIDVRLGEAPGGVGYLAMPDAEFVMPDVEYVVPEIDEEKLRELTERMQRLREERFGRDEERLERLYERAVPLAPMLGYVARPLLGVELVDVTPELRRHFGTDRNAGVLVGRVLEDSAAERAGVRVGDLILAVGEDEVGTSSQLASRIRAHAGEDVVLEVLRDGRSIRLEVSLPEPETPRPSRPRADVGVAPAPAPALAASPVAPAPVAPAPVVAPVSPAPPAPRVDRAIEV